MSIFLGHTTACIFWRTASQDQCDRALPCHAAPSLTSVRSEQAAILAAEGTIFQNSHLDIEIPKGCKATSSGRAEFHRCSETVREYRKIGTDLYVASPELTFVQMASIFSFHELVLFGTELCGDYVRDDYDPTGITTRQAVTTPQALARIISHLGKFSGKDKARRALRAIVPHTASPRETEIAVRLALDNQYGGYGLPPFESNHHIEIPSALKHLTDKRFFKVDFCWPRRKVAVEYDSDLHTGSQKIAQDTMRRNALISLGYTVIGITRIQTNSSRELDRVAEQIARALKIQVRIRCKNYYAQKEMLCRTINRWGRVHPKTYFGQNA